MKGGSGTGAWPPLAMLCSHCSAELVLHVQACKGIVSAVQCCRVSMVTLQETIFSIYGELCCCGEASRL